MNALHEQILQAIKDRKEWEQKQEGWYQLRHQGLRRANKPYPNAPDLHFPLIDASIDKHKPFYVQQIYASETLASFVAKKQQQHETTSSVAAWFDYKVKQESNFEREAISGIDGLLQNGGTPVKVFWNVNKGETIPADPSIPDSKPRKTGRLEFDACDTLHVIVPKSTEELQEADWLVHVLHMSESQYRANPNYRKDDDFIKQIKGKGSEETGDDTGKLQEIARREGLTCGQDDNQIVLWEIYTRDPTNWNRIVVKTRSPLKFDEAVRADFVMPYSEGVFKEGWFPFVKWRGEIKDKGYYSPRGLAEIQAPFETSLCKSWNHKHEYMDFFARPMFEETEGAMGNTGNFKTGPGAIIPRGLKPVIPPPIPPALQEDMNMTRQLAEYRVQAPDFGTFNDQGGKRTATEISAITGQSGQGSDMRARVFRLDLGDTYRMAWSLLLQYGKESLSYVLHNEPQALGAEALHDCYEIMPNGSADSWNKGAQMARAVARFNMHKGNPFVKQGELTKSVLEVDDPSLVPRLYQEPQDAQAGEAEEQNIELLLMTNRFAASVDAPDDDKVHLQVIGQWFPTRMQEQPPLDPITAKLVFDHIQGHGQALQQKKDPLVSQIDRLMKPISGALLQISQSAPQAGNVIPMQQGATPVAGSEAPVSPTGPVAPELQPSGAMP